MTWPLDDQARVIAQGRLDHTRCQGCGLYHDEVEMFLETHELLKWRCRACEIRDAKVSEAMKKKGSKHGVQYRWFPKGEEFTGHMITREDYHSG